jgi:hypothetical protein
MVETAKITPPYKGVCCKRCWFAKRDKCRCKCGGKNHQRGLLKTPETPEEFKKLAMLKSTKLEVTEKICNSLEVALEKHPEWQKYLDEKVVIERL